MGGVALAELRRQAEEEMRRPAPAFGNDDSGGEYDNSVGDEGRGLKRRRTNGGPVVGRYAYSVEQSLAGSCGFLLTCGKNR